MTSTGFDDGRRGLSSWQTTATMGDKEDEVALQLDRQTTNTIYTDSIVNGGNSVDLASVIRRDETGRLLGCVERIQSVLLTGISNFPSDAMYHPDDTLLIAIYCCISSGCNISSG